MKKIKNLKRTILYVGFETLAFFPVYLFLSIVLIADNIWLFFGVIIIMPVMGSFVRQVFDKKIYWYLVVGAALSAAIGFLLIDKFILIFAVSFFMYYRGLRLAENQNAESRVSQYIFSSLVVYAVFFYLFSVIENYLPYRFLLYIFAPFSVIYGSILMNFNFLSANVTGKGKGLLSKSVFFKNILLIVLLLATIFVLSFVPQIGLAVGELFKLIFKIIHIVFKFFGSFFAATPGGGEGGGNDIPSELIPKEGGNVPPFVTAIIAVFVVAVCLFLLIWVLWSAYKAIKVIYSKIFAKREVVKSITLEYIDEKESEDISKELLNSALTAVKKVLKKLTPPPSFNSLSAVEKARFLYKRAVKKANLTGFYENPADTASETLKKINSDKRCPDVPDELVGVYEKARYGDIASGNEQLYNLKNQIK